MNELDVPRSWGIAAFATFGVATGTTPKNREKGVANLPFYKPGDLSYAGPIHVAESEDSVSEGYVEREIRQNSVAVVCIGATLGKSAVIKKSGTFNQQINCILPHPQLIPEFLCYWIRGRYFQDLLWAKVASTTMPIINKTDFSKFTFPLPPFAEQRRIVAKIESTFKLIEDIERGLEDIEMNSRRMAIAFLASEKNSLSTIGNSYSERRERCNDGGDGFRRVGVSNEHGVIDLRIADDIVTTRYKMVRKGDIFYNPMRLNVGSIALYDCSEPAITSPDYVVIRPNNEVCSWLLYSFLKSKIGLQEIAKKTKGSVRERVYFESLAEIAFPHLPQESNLAAMLSFDTLKHVSDACFVIKKQLKDLRSSTLRLAFTGRLVDQDPSEGTGHQLLERICAQSSESFSPKADSKIAVTRPKQRKPKR